MLLVKLPDGGVEVGLAGVDPPAGQFPPAAEVRVVGVVGVEEQHPVPGVHDDEPDRAAFDNG